MADINTVIDLEYMAKLWMHEMMKIYYDRLIDRNDREYFLNKIIDNCK